MIFVLDNYDSFTYNLVQRLGEINPSLDIQVARNDQISISEIESLAPERILISPGPCTPADAGLSKEIIAFFAPKLPILGVCLGHQCIGEVYGAKVVCAPRLMHGKVSEIYHDRQGLFRGLPNPFLATRYHSLIIPEETLPDELEPCAWVRDHSQEWSELMGIRHKGCESHGVQFHPESFLTEAGVLLLRNFLYLPSRQVRTC